MRESAMQIYVKHWVVTPLHIRQSQFGVQAFRSGNMSTADLLGSDHSVLIHTDMSLAKIYWCVIEDSCFTVKELAEYTFWVYRAAEFYSRTYK
jgi:hypothetical protein